MLKFKDKSRNIILLTIVVLFLAGSFAPLVQGLDVDLYKGFDKGPSYKSVVPMKKVTMVGFDEETYIDDYIYLSAVPTAVFGDSEKLYSNPLLFYQDEYKYDSDEERSLNTYQGIDYFMDDWMSYSNGKLDQMTLINVPKSKIDENWDAKEYNYIENNDIYTVSSDLALSEWTYSDNAVLAVVDDEIVEYENSTEGEIKGTVEISKEIKTENFEMMQTNKLNPQFEEFNVPEGYAYIQARAWYACIGMNIGLPLPGFENFMTITIPSGDKDIQLYCMYNDEWMQVEAVAEWNAKAGMDEEYARSYVYTPGKWLVGLTDVPTKKIIDRYGTISERIQNILKGVTYHVDIEMYPGEMIPFEIDPPFYCRDVVFEFESDNDDLKFLLVGPSGEDIKEGVDGKIELNQLGENPEGKKYKFVIFTEDDNTGSYDYTIKYKWSQKKQKQDADYLTDATNGAVLASTLNAPLLYTNPENINDDVKNTLLKLGVNNIHIVDVGSYISKEITDHLDFNYNLIYHNDLNVLYDEIRQISNGNDVIFSTIDPWTQWLVYDDYSMVAPGDETKASLFVGPAAYIAAHHGSPVIIIENHAELSSSVVWHNDLWRNNPNGFTQLPAVAEMYLTGKTVYEFLGENNFDHQDRETIITVAGQYDIGASWDRVFVGKATPGRFTFSPVDCAYWMARNIFYPALIFENPAMDESGVTLINGSESKRTILGTLKITKQSGPEEYEYPVLNSYVSSYIHRFNERAGKYWGSPYECADGIIPGFTHTLNPIDDGVNLKYTGEAGSFWPDLTESENVPFYLSKGGYGNVYSTAFEPTMQNLNSGVLLWMMGSHGWSGNGGAFLFHKSDFLLRKEENPWRGYEPLRGSTSEPDTMTSEIHGVLPWILGNPNKDGVFRSALDFYPAKLPLRDLLGKISSLPLIRFITPDWFEDTQDYYDGVVGSALFSKIGTIEYGGIEIDDSLENIHSCGLVTAACLPAYKYLHVAMVRHGCSYQVIDPWGTSWYSSFWEATIPRDIALGDTVGEAYVKGISHVGILYLGGAGPTGEDPQWWWDIMENVCYFGDPDLRMYVPNTDYSDNNYWEKDETRPISYDAELTVNGHMPFGATSYPNAHEKQELFFGMPLWFIVLLVVIILLVCSIVVIGRKKK